MRYHGKQRELNLALTNASGEGDFKLMQKLLGSGAFVTRGALLAAAGNGQPPVMELLLCAAKSTREDLGMALCQALLRRNWEVAGQLIRGGADSNSKEGLFLAPPLVLAAQHGQTDLVKTLLDAGADPNSHEVPLGAQLLGIHVKQTALMAAATAGHEIIVQVLLDAGADREVKGDKGKTAYESISKRKDRAAACKRWDEWKISTKGPTARG